LQLISSDKSQSGEDGKTLQQALLQLTPPERPFCLQYLEEGARQRGDLQMLREIRAYKALQSHPISTKLPHSD
jgi:hypothetical protein